MKDYLRGLDKETFEKVVKTCREKVEGLNDKDWQDIVEEFNLGIHRDVLRKSFQAPIGGYSILKYMEEKELENQPKNKVEEISEIIGELELKKQDVRQKTVRLNKIKRELGNTVIITNDIKEFLDERLDGYEAWTLPIIESNDDYKLIIGVQDWHLGYVINNYKGNSYNLDIAKIRLNKLIAEAKKTCEIYGISDVVIIHLGDIIENSYMRDTQQAYECEFMLSEQISVAIETMFEFTKTISEFANVEVGMIGGNHSRMSDKAKNIEGDNANIIIREQVKKLFEITKNSRVSFLDVDYIDDSCVFEINRLKVKAIHGDNRVSDKKKLYDTEATIDGEAYDIIMLGHYHNFQLASQNSGGYVITGGSLFGYNPYSIKKIACNTNASQTLIVVGDGVIESIRDVNLQFN